MSTNSRGFTLLELIIIIGILGLTMAFAAPGLSTMIKNNRISGAANDFIAALQFAKAETVSRLNPVTMCKRNTEATACVPGGDWQQGWIVFSDINGDAAVNGADTVLLAHEALHTSISFGGTANVDSTITIRPTGMISPLGGGSLILCDDRGYSQSARRISVIITGRGEVVPRADTGAGTCL